MVFVLLFSTRYFGRREERMIVGSIKVAVIDDNRQLIESVRKVLDKETNIIFAGSGNDGHQALKLIEREKPDVVLLDLVMPKLDGLGVLEQVGRSQGEKPAFIVISAIGQENIAESALERGACYYMMKPFDEQVLVRRIRQAYRQRMLMPFSNSDFGGRTYLPIRLEEDITFMIHEVGMPAHLQGYQYLRDAVRMAVLDRNTLHSVTKWLYPEIAAKNHTTSHRVERSIRHAIEVAWDRGQTEVLNEIFGNTVHQAKGKPTNSEFIAMFADRIRMKYNIP